MSGRILSHRLVPLLRTGFLARHVHNAGARTGGLLRSDGSAALRGRAWPVGANSIHNVPAVRGISFARILPKLALKLVKVPAMLGTATVAGLAYIQYQTTQAGNYAIDVLKRAGESAGDAASSIFSEIQNVAEQTQRGWQRTTDSVEVPEWLQNILGFSEGSQNDGSGGGGQPPRESRAGAAAAAGAAALGYDQDDEHARLTRNAEDDQMMLLTRKMIEIRNILQAVGQSNTLTLPSIVVIGSQSSGKSSVLEAIVGHEFLPKGSNMVTRRPIELTLVNTPHAQAEYGEFPALGLGKITDFSSIQRTLTDLNLAVPERDCVSDDPIQLTIYSPNVPDLSLIDLPGYIQVSGQGQPPQLKQKISDLCDKYIQAPNVILAISAADVDLANSTALRASRRVDPRGERTIGVITKMDLVDPERGHSILTDKKYPLRLGYVGVVSRIPQTTALFSSRGSGNITSAIMKNENAYFSSHPSEFGPQSEVSVGVGTLRTKLMHVLEQTMASSLAGTRDAISQELEEATYEFKVQYNDRPLSAESYLAESLDSFKHSFKAFAENFGRPQVREMLKNELDQRVMDILAQRYWNKPIDDLNPPMPELDPLIDLPKADPESMYWHRKLDASTSSLTKLGIGRLATTVVAGAIQNHVESLLASSTFASHPYAQKQIVDACSSILNDRFFSTSDQVENCIKPYKYEIEVEDPEWAKGRENITRVLKEELKACEAALKRVEDSVGRRKIKDVMSFIDKVRKGEVVLEGDGAGGAGGFSSALLATGRESAFLRDRADLLKMRLLAVRSKQCASKKNKYYCPEVFLDVVADKLTSTAVLFLNVELLSEFYYNFPRELDMRLGRHLSDAEVERFAREDPRIRRHLDVIKKKELLELALQKIESIRQLDGRSKHRNTDRPLSKEQRNRGWNLF
ncbi:P-loop containing nucleoside triphosphate hydrolase protein [Aspergillus pseudonomiae]|uniref:dynamin GTPase n=1 Tax=Aspergillus pseudonomiae TaxID=1506151 RepID=A0A5N7CVE0_9EURO|nr:P-loop containing nucleoside triphosphate hydrolase protein [Aspergillus pseudonomiae]KAB8263462.1 P-loop containing nucleoside triphosphate hydrolase protein [Aspergillus pseudonomiae]KAE8397939.1 P-loop containing nucleoside triphosphate hydrolase protein [Aspergillus pseudonomiae]